MTRISLVARIAIMLAGLAVGLGALAAHGLERTLSERMMEVFRTGIRYQVIHALATLLVAALGDRLEPRWAGRAGRAFLAGIVLFSGSLYALALTGVRPLGAITPFGGLAFLVGWVCLARAAWKKSQGPPGGSPD